MRRPAFTLIELLVVITIIVVLLALLTPALDRAMEQAERAECGARLDGWGIAIAQHYLDNSRKLLTAQMLGGQYPYPSQAYTRNQPAPEDRSIGLDRIGPYIAGTGGVLDYVPKAFYCPSNGVLRETMDSWAKSSVSYVYIDYSYFGVAERYRRNASDLDHLVGRSLGEGKLLMNDKLFKWNGSLPVPEARPGAWDFNHSDIGPSNHDTGTLGSGAYQGVPPITGTNQLFGDGSVKWKPGSEFDTVAMDSGNPSDQSRQAMGGYVSSEPGPNPSTDLTFY